METGVRSATLILRLIACGADVPLFFAGGPVIGRRHPYVLAKYLYEHLRKRRHGNGQRVATLYCDSQFVTMETQGPIVAFNLFRGDGSFIGYSQVSQLEFHETCHSVTFSLVK